MIFVIRSRSPAGRSAGNMLLWARAVSEFLHIDSASSRASASSSSSSESSTSDGLSSSAPGSPPSKMDGAPDLVTVAPGRAGGRRPAAIAVRVGLGLLAGAVITLAGPQLGASWPPAILATLLVGAVAVTAVPDRAQLLAGLCGIAVLAQWVALRTAGYHLLLVGAAFVLRRRPVALGTLLVLAVMVIPKELFRRYYHQPFLHDWVNPFLLANFFLVVLAWVSADQRGRVSDASVPAWLTLLLFPTHPLNPLPFSPTDLARPRTAGAGEVLLSLLIVGTKAAALAALAWAWPRGQLGQQGSAELLGAGPLALWRSVAHSYLACALTLSGTADLVIVVARLFGWPLPHSFRWALLAWNPVELWRRWAIYNRKVLLTLVYFPLGGGQRRRTLNVMLTFGASGLVLHAGWLGSRYWETGIAGWRDQTVYFLLQGVAVSACLLYWRWRGKDPASDRQIRWSWGRALGVAATQATSAWLHILVLAPGLTFTERWQLMARCLGLPW
jgi:hypothetical protein